MFLSYKAALALFGATPYDLPRRLDIQSFIGWLEEEFESLGDVMKTANDNCAMICSDGFAKFLEHENHLLFDRMVGKKFKFPKDLGSHSPGDPQSPGTIK